MSRYIDADKAKEKLGVVRSGYSCFLEEDRPYYDVLSETIKMINEMPTADVRENVKGQWLDYWDNPIKSYFDGRYSAHCSVCGYHPEYEEEMHSANFCPNCGADMRGEL